MFICDNNTVRLHIFDRFPCKFQRFPLFCIWLSLRCYCQLSSCSATTSCSCTKTPPSTPVIIASFSDAPICSKSSVSKRIFFFFVKIARASSENAGAIMISKRFCSFSQLFFGQLGDLKLQYLRRLKQGLLHKHNPKLAQSSPLDQCRKDSCA